MTTETTTRERPILFSGPMVLAILSGRKTQTRRVIRPDWWRCLDPDDEEDLTQALKQCPYGQPGDRLWVRETVVRCGTFYNPVDGEYVESHYAADDVVTKADRWPWQRSKLPAIHMPRGLCRLFLDVVRVRIERLQDISVDDARAEGMPPDGTISIKLTRTGIDGSSKTEDASAMFFDPMAAFSHLWDGINGERAPWKSNPWVWVVEFRRVHANRSSEGT